MLPVLVHFPSARVAYLSSTTATTQLAGAGSAYQWRHRWMHMAHPAALASRMPGKLIATCVASCIPGTSPFQLPLVPAPAQVMKSELPKAQALSAKT